jgi:hypothetical protein
LIAIISLLVVVFLSILITRIATIALTHTGLTRESAKFQARSAFFGAGFTTEESEMVVRHPVRRKIVMTLILIGNAGIVAAISSLILTFVKQSNGSTLTIRVLFLVMGLLGLWLVSSSKLADRWLSTIVERLLNRYTRLNVKDYASLLHLTGEYRLVELNIRRNDWVDGKKMSDIRLRDEGINVLGIRKADGNYVGNPIGDTRIEQKDTLVVYGHIEAIKKIDLRKKGVRGDIDHVKAVKKQKQEVSKEKKKE